VDKVDQSKKELTLRLKVSDSTQVMKDGKSATLSDIKEGDQVRASFSPTGEAQRIEVVSGAGGGSRGMSPHGGAGGSSTSPGSTGSSGSSTSPGSSGSSGSTGAGGSSGSSGGKGY
jgi:hypothetical protein